MFDSEIRHPIKFPGGVHIRNGYREQTVNQLCISESNSVQDAEAEDIQTVS